MLSAIKGLKRVTGFWSLFHKASYNSLVPGFSDRVEVSPYFLESSLIVGGVIILAFVVRTLLIYVRLFCQKEEPLTEENSTKYVPDSKLNKPIELLYTSVIFPLTAGFLLVLLLAGFVNNMRLPSAN
jgi:hypothetical protein